MSDLGGTSLLSSQLLVYRRLINKISILLTVLNCIAIPLLVLINLGLFNLYPFDLVILFLVNILSIVIYMFRDMGTTIDDMKEITILGEELASYGIDDKTIHYIMRLLFNFRNILTDSNSFESSLRDWNVRYNLNIDDTIISNVSNAMFK